MVQEALEKVGLGEAEAALKVEEGNLTDTVEVKKRTINYLSIYFLEFL